MLVEIDPDSSALEFQELLPQDEHRQVLGTTNENENTGDKYRMSAQADPLISQTALLCSYRKSSLGGKQWY